jgi:hypothetical protein
MEFATAGALLGELELTKFVDAQFAEGTNCNAFQRFQLSTIRRLNKGDATFGDLTLIFPAFSTRKLVRKRNVQVLIEMMTVKN